jgi:hypothetical protein
MKWKTNILKIAHGLIPAVIVIDCKHRLAVIITSLHLLETYLSAYAHAARLPAHRSSTGAPVPM